MRVSQVTLLHEYLERAASAGDKTALIFKKRRLAWAEVHALAGRVASALRARGLRRGDRVVLFMDNSPELCAALFGVLAADGVFSVVNAQTKSEKLAYVLNDCRARVVVTDRVLERVWRSAFAKAAHLESALVVDLGDAAPVEGVDVVDFAAATGSESPLWPAYRNIPSDLAAIIYTSGSTGDAKGVMLTHANMVAAAESITAYLGSQSDDVVLNLLPMSFDYGLYQWLMVTAKASTLALEMSFNYPAAVLKLIDEERVSTLPVVPTIASILKQYEEKGVRLPHVRTVTNTAAALSLAHIETLRKLCPNARLFSMYGLTECKRVSYLPPDQLDTRPLSVGKPMPNLEAFVVDGNGRRLGPNEIGELVVRGPHVMRGYWEKPEVTAEWLKPSPEIPGEMWLHTGDQFKTDEEGFLYFLGRRDDIIKTRGEKVSPREVENVLYGIPGVVDAAVVGEDDPVLGQAVRAFLVLADGVSLTPQQVIAACNAELEGFLVPRKVTFLSSLPKTSTGKISKKGIWEHAAGFRVGGDEV